MSDAIGSLRRAPPGVRCQARAASAAGLELPQYSRRRVLGTWALAALPMAVLGWVVNPAIAPAVDGATGVPGTARIVLMTLGLVWQSVLVLLSVRREARVLSWPTLRERLWLGVPRHPRTGRADPRLWWWLLLLVPLFAAMVFLVEPGLERTWVTAFPALAAPEAFGLARLAGAPAVVGAWWLYGLFLVMALFNTVLGEELLFRGLLLPRMRGAFGRWDWLANGVLFGCYHLHQPWGIPGAILDGTLLCALPSRRFRSAGMGIAVHSAQSVYFAVVLLPLVLGRR